MKINDTRKRVKDSFGELACGTVFVTHLSEGSDVYYMKTILVSDKDDLTCNAVCLDDGDMLYFTDNTPVIVPDCELTIK